MRVVVIAPGESSALDPLLEAALRSLGHEVIALARVATAAFDAGVVLRQPSFVDVVRDLRAAHPSAPIVAVADELDGTAAIEAGADEIITPQAITSSNLHLALDRARARRRAGIDDARILSTLPGFIQSLAHEGLEGLVERALTGMLERLDLSVGLAAVEWDLFGSHGRAHLLHGSDPSPEHLAQLLENAQLCPLLARPGLTTFEAPLMLTPAPGSPAIAQVLHLPLAAGDPAVRGGIALFSLRAGVLHGRAAVMADLMAAWTGIAFRYAAAMAEQKRAVEMRERTLQVASHDLRTPLSVFSMTAELLAESEDPEDRRILRGKALRSVESMRRLTADILDFAALDSGQLRIERQPIDACAVATRVVSFIQAATPANSLPAIDLRAEGTKSVVADAGRIEQALTNILQNAVKFTPASGRIEVQVLENARHVIFSVEDSGPGIPESEQPKVFDRYQSRSESKQGIGLGLSIARGIAEAHGGSLFVESTVGQGAIFRMTLPKSSPN